MLDIKTRATLGWAALIIISLIPVLLWFTLGPGPSELTSYGGIVHSFGELFGLVGMTMFALTFVLSTRIRAIEDVFGGLDKVYIVHGIFGGTALILILFHPIFLVLKFVPSNIVQAAIYLMPSSFWSVNFGILAILGMIILIYITLFTKMKYHRWKFTHEFLGAVFVFAVLHIFLVRGTVSSDYIFRGYYVYAAVVSAIGLSAFSYSLFLKNRLIKNAVYSISKIKHKQNFLTIDLVPEHKPIHYKSGQFIFVRFYNEHLSEEPHPFSIASGSNEKTIRIIVKKLGDFTKRLSNLKEGDKVSIEGPYGKFSEFLPKNKDQIWIAAGIGIVPFIGLAEDILEHKKHSEKKIDLYYTAKDTEDFVGKETFNKLAETHHHFRFIPWESSRQGRLTMENIKKRSGSFEGKEFLMCGPSKFKEDFFASLIKEGVKKDNIHEEVFDFR